MSQYEIAKIVLDKCNSNVIDFLLIEPLNKAQPISECLNTKLSTFGLNT